MEINEQPVAYVPTTNVTVNTEYNSEKNFVLSAWELVQTADNDDEHLTCLKADITVYRNKEGKPYIHPDSVTGAAAIRITDKLSDKVFLLCMLADDTELLAFDNETTMAKFRVFAGSAESHFYIELSYEYYLCTAEEDDTVNEPAVYQGLAAPIPRDFLQIELIDLGTGQVIKPIFGCPVHTSLDDSI